MGDPESTLAAAHLLIARGGRVVCEMLTRRRLSRAQVREAIRLVSAGAKKLREIGK